MSGDELNPLWVARGLRLKKARKDAGWKLGAPAARELKIPIGTYNQYESGRRNIEPQVELLASFFNVSEAWLLDGKEDDMLERVVKAIRGLEPSQQTIAAAAALGAIQAVTKR